MSKILDSNWPSSMILAKTGVASFEHEQICSALWNAVRDGWFGHAQISDGLRKPIATEMVNRDDVGRCKALVEVLPLATPFPALNSIASRVVELSQRR